VACSGADAAGNPASRGLLGDWLAATGRGPRDPEHVSLLAGRAIMLLICADVIRASLGWLLPPATPAGIAAEMARAPDPAGFAALTAICQANCVNSHTTQLAPRRSRPSWPPKAARSPNHHRRLRGTAADRRCEVPW